VRIWKRADRRMQCGYVDGCWIESGQPYLERKGGEWSRALLRCETHAGEPAGAIEEPSIAVTRPPATARPLSWLANRARAKVLKHPTAAAPPTVDARARAARNDE
jgi:hypothetical protein